MYIAEIAPPDKRGRLVGFFQFNIVFGILLAYFSNYVVGTMASGDAEWRWKLGIAAIPAALFSAMLFTIPESPRWLARRGRMREAENVLRQIGDPNWQKDLAEISASVDEGHGAQSEPLFQSRYKFPIFLAVSIGMFNQFSGINAVLYYLNDIFAQAGFTKVSSDLQAVAVGATNLLFTMIAMSVIDKIGRKKLLLIGSIGTAVAQAGVAAIFLSGSRQDFLLWFLVAFIAFFAFSQGAVIWVYLSEVFPTKVRAKGQSLGSFTHWIMNALISGVFPVLAAWSRGGPFVFFAVMMVVQFFVVLATYPETKGYSLEEMQKKLGGRIS
jgi:SP family arabinose:H+ symporter-like MFS transporter